MFKIAIVDDDGIFAAYALNSIKQIMINNNIDGKVQILDNGFSLIENYTEYDLILLDIDMPIINGIETAKKINGLKSRSNSPYVVFVTSKDHLVFDALKQYPFAFIRKSHFNSDIEECIIKATDTIIKTNDKYFIKAGRNIVTVFLNDILYMEKQGNYIVIHLSDRQYNERGNIETKQAELSDKDFIRTHIGYLVNLNHIVELESSDIILDSGEKIPLSRNYKQKVKEQYFDWMVTH